MSTDPSRPGEPEYLGDAPSARTERSTTRRWPVLGIAAAGVVGVVGLGGWAAMSLMADGTQPAEAVPANAIGYVSLDLDPTAEQKVEAVRILRKFPAIAEELDLSSQDDLRRWVFEQMQQDGVCEDLDYARDVEPWIGDRIALAGVPGDKTGDEPTPLVALQVTDTDAATAGIAKLAGCGDAGDHGVAVSGDYVLVSDSQPHADALAASVEQGTLADDADYQRWMERVGDPGIVTMYAAPGAVDAVLDMRHAMSDELTGPGGRHPMFPRPDMDTMREQLEKMAADFEGMAGVIRFEDGAVEAELAGETSPEDLITSGDRAGVTELPASTALALGVSLQEGWSEKYVDMLGRLLGAEGSVDRMLSDAEAMTGLELPEDIERLLGDGFALSADRSLDLAAASRNPAAVPAGIRVSGDPAEIKAVVAKIRTALGPQAGMLVVEEGDGVVAFGLDADYVRELAGQGALGDQVVFQDVVPDPDRAGAVFFLDLDAVELWVSQGMELSGETGPRAQRIQENLAPLRALGVSASVDEDGTERALMRLSTD
ncbi:MAG TPA: DUF3352 domain-containing protein [Nocardioidaceae bacterium]|nr:DUF3352 domain-containing protein [Nocardioidaceae bacterium]